MTSLALRVHREEGDENDRRELFSRIEGWWTAVFYCRAGLRTITCSRFRGADGRQRSRTAQGELWDNRAKIPPHPHAEEPYPFHQRIEQAWLATQV